MSNGTIPANFLTDAQQMCGLCNSSLVRWFVCLIFSTWMEGWFGTQIIIMFLREAVRTKNFGNHHSMGLFSKYKEWCQEQRKCLGMISNIPDLAVMCVIFCLPHGWLCRSSPAPSTCYRKHHPHFGFPPPLVFVKPLGSLLFWTHLAQLHNHHLRDI